MAPSRPARTWSSRLGADPATLGRVPASVDRPALRPDVDLLPAADLVAFHGGSGTMLAALAAARPMVIVPLAADQPDNADRVEAAGVARSSRSRRLTADAVRLAIEAVLGDPAFRQRAAAVAAEIAAMPGPDAAVDRTRVDRRGALGMPGHDRHPPMTSTAPPQPRALCHRPPTPSTPRWTA